MCINIGGYLCLNICTFQKQLNQVLTLHMMLCGVVLTPVEIIVIINLRNHISLHVRGINFLYLISNFVHTITSIKIIFTQKAWLVRETRLLIQGMILAGTSSLIIVSQCYTNGSMGFYSILMLKLFLSSLISIFSVTLRHFCFNQNSNL